jgi:hypothetical protein
VPCRAGRYLNGTVPFLDHEYSVADPDPGWVTKQSGSGSGIRIRDEQPGSYFRELRNNFFG